MRRTFSFKEQDNTLVGKFQAVSQLLKVQTQVMDALMSIVEGRASVTDINNIDHEKLKAFQAKCSVWDFYDMTKEDYINKLPSEKQDMILSYYNKMVQGMLFVICCLQSGLCHFYCLAVCQQFGLCLKLNLQHC